MSNLETLALVVRGHHLFAGLSPPQLQRVLAASHVDEYEPGQYLFDRGQPAQHFYIVVEGQVNLVLHSKAGEEKIVDILGPGNSFAEAVLFMEGPVYPVSAVAAARSQVARFQNREYLTILRESPETCLRMLGHLSQRLHMRLREIEYLTLESATHRLVRMIEGRLPAGGRGTVRDQPARIAAGAGLPAVDEARDPVQAAAEPVGCRRHRREWTATAGP